MIAPRLLLATMVLACFGTACTVIVLGKVSDTEDYKTVPTGTSSGGSTLDECSLLKGDYYATDHDANACSTCIQTSCAGDVTYACNAGSNKSAKPWFKDLKDCAQNPWNGFKPPNEPSGYGWDCKKYTTPEPLISDNGSDTERDRKAQNCVHDNCLQGELPACKMCEVHIKKSPSDPTEALLRDDGCGKCLVEKCQPELVKCCDTPAMQDYVAKCAFTADPENKATCLELFAAPDGGPKGSYSYDDAGIHCLAEISQCFKANCKTGYQCQ